VSDDIPIIFAEDIRRTTPAPVAVFASAASMSQMQQYAAGGWKVIALPTFKSSAPINLIEVPALTQSDTEIAGCTLLSCEAPFLRPETSGLIARWKPDYLKFNCAFHDVADASALATSLAGLGYTVLAAHWRDDNSFAYRSLAQFVPLNAMPVPEWGRTNLIGVRDKEAAAALLSIARLYVGEERRIADLRVANAIRNDHIARLEDALMAHQNAAAVKSPPS